MHTKKNNLIKPRHKNKQQPNTKSENKKWEENQSNRPTQFPVLEFPQLNSSITVWYIQENRRHVEFHQTPGTFTKKSNKSLRVKHKIIETPNRKF